MGLMLSGFNKPRLILIFTARQRSPGKVMFSQVSVNLFTGDLVPSHNAPGTISAWNCTSHGTIHPPGSYLPGTIQKRAVHILMECFLDGLTLRRGMLICSVKILSTERMGYLRGFPISCGCCSNSRYLVVAAT